MMEFHRYDVIEVENRNATGSVQSKRRPCIIVSNERGTSSAEVVTVVPLTHVIKKEYLPTHECLDVETENGLEYYSMLLGEQLTTICKSEVVRKLGVITNPNQKNKVNKVCYLSFFYGEKINWKEVLR